MERILELEKIIQDMRIAYVKGWVATQPEYNIDNLTTLDLESLYIMLLTKAKMKGGNANDD